jgi:hypothetical protein
MRARSTSKSSASRTFVARTREALAELMSRRLDDVRLAVLMLDGIELKGRTNVVALGITTGREDPARAVGGLEREQDGRERPALGSHRPRPGCRAGRARGIDGAKALRAAVCAVLGDRTRSRGAFVTGRGTSSSTCPSATVPPSSGGCGARGHATITGTPWTSFGTRRGAGALASRRHRIAPRAPRGDAHRHPPRRQPRAQAHAREHEPLRVDDRVRGPQLAQRQAAGTSARWGCAGRPRGCSKPSGSSAGSSATATSRSSP